MMFQTARIDAAARINREATEQLLRIMSGMQQKTDDAKKLKRDFTHGSAINLA